MSRRRVVARSIGLEIVRRGRLLVVMLVLAYSTSAAAQRHPGLHANYFIGAETEEGFAQGLELGFVPSLFFVDHNAPRDSVSSDSGYLVSLCAGKGFGDTPNFMSVEVGIGMSSVIGYSLAVGPMMQFSGQDPTSYGATARIAFDLFLLQAGLRVFDTYHGDVGNRFGAVFTVGVGRY